MKTLVRFILLVALIIFAKILLFSDNKTSKSEKNFLTIKSTN